MVHSQLRFIRRELLWVHNPLLDYSVHTKVDKITGLSNAIETHTTQNFANSTHNSSRQINRRYEWTIT